ncbi:MAG: flavin reductase family protein, partial [Acidimicrobiales bacterium]
MPGPVPGDEAVEAARFRDVLGHFCTGVTVVTGMAGAEPVGFTAQSFTSVSLHPPLVGFCPRRTSASYAAMRQAGSFCVNILDAAQASMARAFAEADAARFRGVGWEPSAHTGSPVLDGVLGWVDCTVAAEHEAGDHLIVLGRVIDLAVAGGGG